MVMQLPSGAAPDSSVKVRIKANILSMCAPLLK
jgi:hypothetical protein